MQPFKMMPQRPIYCTKLFMIYYYVGTKQAEKQYSIQKYIYLEKDIKDTY